MTRTWAPNPKTEDSNEPHCFMWSCCFSQFSLASVVWNWPRPWNGRPPSPQFSSTARSFPCDVGKAGLTHSYQCSGRCNQREPICPGWLLIWPWPPASGLFCPSLALALPWSSRSPLLKASHATSVTWKTRKSEPAPVCWPFHGDSAQWCRPNSSLHSIFFRPENQGEEWEGPSFLTSKDNMKT